MSWLDVLLGRQKPVQSKLENLFAITTAYVTLQTSFGLSSTGKAGVCFRPITSSDFTDAEAEVRGLLKISGQEEGTRVQFVADNYGFQWIVLADPQFENLVATIHMVSQTLQERGFGEQMLAALFQFRDQDGRLAYWIYNYKRGTFYPLVPLANQQRDNAYEIRLRDVMERELPVESDLSRWYPLWDVPL